MSIAGHERCARRCRPDGYLEYILKRRESDPITILQDDVLENDGGQLTMINMSPNFEISLYLAQATGSFIVTDSIFRWKEILHAQHREGGIVTYKLRDLTNDLGQADHCFVFNTEEVTEMRRKGKLSEYRRLIQCIYDYLCDQDDCKDKTRSEAQLLQRFSDAHALSQKEIGASKADAIVGKFRCIIPNGGIAHNNVRRMLLTGGVDRHNNSVPMAFFMEREDVDVYEMN